MKVAIITFHRVLNNGAVLQAYGLCQAIERLGHQVELVDYRPEGPSRPDRRWGIKSMTFVSKVVKRYRFDRFRKDNLPLTKRVYLKTSDLYDHPPPADVYISGSDQVWNVKLTEGVDEAFLLGFAPRERRKLSYAASFGGTEPAEDQKEPVAVLLRDFDVLTVRDRFSQDLVRRLTGRLAEVVVDPTLLGDYGNIVNEPNEPGEYVFAFSITDHQHVDELACGVSRRLSLPIIGAGRQFRDAVRVCNDLGPSEWLGYIRRAAFVCTDSFHGVLLSLLNQRDFASPMLPERLLSRFDPIIGQLGLWGRFVQEPSELVRGSGDLRLDHDLLGRQIQVMKRDSLAYLARALEFAVDDGVKREMA